MRGQWIAFLAILYNAIHIVCLNESLKGSTSADLKQVSTLEQEVFGFRLWMILAFVFAGLAVIIIVLCCIFDCRIPRTKQEIDADYERKTLAEQYVKEMEKIPKNRPIKIVRAHPANVLPGSVFRGGAPSHTLNRSEEAGPSREGYIGSYSTPLAQHPTSLMSSTVERKLRNTTEMKGIRPGQVATAKTLASLVKMKKTAQGNTKL